MNRKSLKLNDLFEKWLESGLYNRKPSTNEKYRRIFDNHIKNFIGQKHLSELNSEVVNSFLNELAVNGSINGATLSVTYIRTIAFVIKSALKYGSTHNLCNSVYLDIKLPSKKRHEVEILSREYRVALSRYLMYDTNEKKLAVLLALHLGLRIGEVCALKHSDIDFAKKTVHIQRNISRLGVYDDSDAKSILCAGEVKTISSDRIIPLQDYLIDILLKFVDNGSEYIFKGRKYPYIDPRTLRNALNIYCDECDIPRVKFHALRHSFATSCIEHGMDIKTLSELLGHSNINITLDLYVHSTIDHKREQLESVSNCYLIGG